MSAEFIVCFEDIGWYAAHLDTTKRRITGLETYFERIGEHEFRLRGTEPRRPGDWHYDVRLFLEDRRVFLEISAHPLSIEADLSALLGWLRSCTPLSILDEDGGLSGW